MLNSAPTSEVDRLQSEVNAGTVARYFMTSGSTGQPKLVPNTQGMLMTSVGVIESIKWSNYVADNPVLVNSLPWHHIFASNHNFNMALRSGTTIVLEDGRPTRALFHKTLANLKRYRPSVLATVPLAYNILCEALETDLELRHAVFSRLEYMNYGGAGLSPAVYDRLRELARISVGRDIPMFSSYGATEFSVATSGYWKTDRSNIIGLPLPGVEMKLQPVHQKLEVRVRGNCVMPKSGYLGNPEATARAFDEEGYYCTGDTADFADPDCPEIGLVFTGRISEEFKLATGTWVSAGVVRQHLMEFISTLATDALVCGESQKEIGVVVWLHDKPKSSDRIATEKSLSECVHAYNKLAGSSSTQIARLLISDTAPALEQGELTEKGTVSQVRMWASRAAEIAELFGAVTANNRILLNQFRSCG
jgi:feruloyl-CoA synthase